MKALLVIVLILNLSEAFCQSKYFTKRKIYSSVISEYLEFLKDCDDINSVVIIKSTSNQDHFNSTQNDSLLQFLSKKLTRKIIPRRVPVRKIKSYVPIHGLSKLKSKLIFRNLRNGWKRFYEKYPKSYGIMRVSNIVFTKDSKYCILNISYNRRPRHGAGVLLLIELNDKPKIIKEIALWKS